jgi:threonine dehydrogenase-like Zn-dependent dehydrogenase
MNVSPSAQFDHAAPRSSTATKRITIERVAMPEVAVGEVLVRVSRTALCGSDFKLWHKGAEFTAGHEIFGVVEQPGHRLHGRRCAVYIPLHCDRCACLQRADTQMCLKFEPDRLEPGRAGYAEYVPVPENCLLPVPDDIEDSLAPLLLELVTAPPGHAVRFVSRVVPPRGWSCSGDGGGAGRAWRRAGAAQPRL